MENGITARGRKSVAKLSVIAGGVVSSVRRPDPPPHMSDDARCEWVAVVERMPADWFPRETHAVLELYCEHVVTARRLTLMLDRGLVDGMGVKDIKDLRAMREGESRTATSHATKLRITQQSSYSADKKRGPVLTLPKPWEDK